MHPCSQMPHARRARKRHWFFALICSLILLWTNLAIAESATSPPLRVMTFNVRLPVDSDGANRWEARRALIAEVVAQEAPDLIGTQELFRRQADDLVERLPRYAWFGRDRRGGGDDEHMGVFYRTDRLRVLDSGDFWLSDTPDVAGSITWGNLYPRMVTWARFERLADGSTFVFYNTHLPYREQDESARSRAAALIVSRLRQLPAAEAVVITGDFNAPPDSQAHALLSAALSDAWTAAPRRTGPAETFHNFTGKADRRIDWILFRGMRVKSIRTATLHHGKRYPSDHFPVVAEFELPGAAP